VQNGIYWQNHFYWGNRNVHIENNVDITSRDIVVTTDEQYPRSACFTLRNEQAQTFNLNIGQRVRVDFDIDARPNRDGSRYFNQLKCWRITCL
jgi:hypothetical protein